MTQFVPQIEKIQKRILQHISINGPWIEADTC